ncbi:MAG: hypothetical protein DRR16_02490 [Candidatus Parabeggiatoa sp. nov. 3]|nr:MAG: hypothetical protein DRQ99_02675 [Gammaproteobacteria bacterium]RKZ89405.1 MAG: hypothetical protein DRR16_02490 [Gammaproteobacteria bacterium]
MKLLRELIHFIGSISSILGLESIGTFLSVITPFLISLFIVDSLVFRIQIIVLLTLVLVFFIFRKYNNEFNQLKDKFNQLENKFNEYKNLKEEYNTLKSKVCFFVSECHILNQEGDNVLAPYLRRENAYFLNISEVETAIENCKSCARNCRQLYSTEINRLRMDLDHFSQGLAEQNFRVVIDFCKEDASIAHAIQEYLEENRIHCTQFNNNLSKLSQLLDRDTAVILLYYNRTIEPTVKERLIDYKHASLRLNNKKQLRLLVCSSNKPFTRLPQNMEWIYLPEFSPETCLDKITTQIEGLTNG